MKSVMCRIRFLKIILFTFIYIAFSVQGVSAKPSNKLSTHPESDFSNADSLDYAANQGNREAQYLLALLYRSITPADNNMAFSWLLKSAENGYAPAQLFMGAIYHYGEDTPRNFKMAFNWYKKAAIQGDASAADNLGVFYLDGLGVEKNCQLAIEWFETAAEWGYPASASNLVWTLATCPDAQYRDGHKAVKLALSIIKNTKNPDAPHFDNLAAAYAETGNFEDAIKSQEDAIELLQVQNNDPVRLLKYHFRLENYKNDKPTRGAPSSDPLLY
jgi:tetratricopeptide (TPR) repeat protein